MLHCPPLLLATSVCQSVTGGDTSRTVQKLARNGSKSRRGRGGKEAHGT